MGRGLTNLEYAFMAEEMGKHIIASESMNCSLGDLNSLGLYTKPIRCRGR